MEDSVTCTYFLSVHKLYGIAVKLEDYENTKFLFKSSKVTKEYTAFEVEIPNECEFPTEVILHKQYDPKKKFAAVRDGETCGDIVYGQTVIHAKDHSDVIDIDVCISVVKFKTFRRVWLIAGPKNSFSFELFHPSQSENVDN